MNGSINYYFTETRNLYFDKIIFSNFYQHGITKMYWNLLVDYIMKLTGVQRVSFTKDQIIDINILFNFQLCHFLIKVSLYSNKQNNFSMIRHEQGRMRLKW